MCWIKGPVPFSYLSGYVIQRYTVATGYTTLATITNPATMTYADTTAVLGTTYTYRIQAYYVVGGGTYYGAYAYSAAVLLRGVITITPPSTPINAYLGDTVTVTMPFTDTDSRATHHGTINWGDGTGSTTLTVTEESGSTPGTITATHAYTTSGEYTTATTLMSSDNAQSTASATIDAQPVPPPTVATAAAADPSPVTGTSTSLSVLGSQLGSSESTLIYTWSVVSAPSGGTISFSDNGTNAAQNTTATFIKAGTYSLKATIASGSQTVTSTVTIVVEQSLTSIAITPSGMALLPEATQQFAAVGTDQFGNAMSAQPAFTWSVSDTTVGTISSAGLFSAGQSYGPDTVTVSSGGVSQTALVTVSPITPSAPLTAVATDSSDIELYWLDLPALSSGATLEMSEDSTFSTGVTSVPIAAHTTNYTASGLSPATTYYFELLPSSGTTVIGTASAATPAVPTDGSPSPAAPQITQQATASQQDPNDDTLTMAASSNDPVEYSWQLISSPGSAQAPDFTADAQTTTTEFYAAGTYVFLGTATDASTGLSTPSDVTVTVGQVLSHIQFSFGSPTIMQGATEQFAATALDQFGNAVATQPSFSWSASGGSITASGLYTAPSSGNNTTCAVTASSGGITSTAGITIANPGLYIGNDGLIYVQATDVNEVKVFNTSSAALVETLPFNGPFPAGITFRGAQDIYLGDGSYLDASPTAPYYPLTHKDAGGNVIKTYLSASPDLYWTGMALDPGGTSFWACDQSCDVFEFNIATGAQEQEFYASNDLLGLGVEPLPLGIKLGDGSTNQVLQASSDGTRNLVPLQLYMPSNLPSGTTVTLTANAPGGMDLWNSSNPSSGSSPLDGGDGWTYTFTSGQQVPSELWVGATGPSVNVGDIQFTLDVTPPGADDPSSTTAPATAIDPKMQVATILDNYPNGYLTDAQLASQGAYVPLDNGDWDYNGVEDLKQSEQVPDDQYLLPVLLSAIPGASNADSYTLQASGGIKIWMNNQNVAGKQIPANVDNTVYVEGVAVAQSSRITASLLLNGLTYTLSPAPINVFEMDGPLDVPGDASYRYSAGYVPGSAQWQSSANASSMTQVAGPTTATQVVWKNQPAVANLPLEVDQNYTWQMDVNVVKVSVNISGSSITDPGVPYQDNKQANYIHSGIGGASDAMAATVPVTLQGPYVQGPDGIYVQRGISHIQVGFIQDVQFAYVNSVYGAAGEEVSSLQGSSYVDWLNVGGNGNNGFGPWYDDTGDRATAYVNEPSDPLVPDEDDITMETDDTPYFPVTDNSLTNGTVLDTVNGAAISSAALVLKFSLYLAIATTDSENFADDVFTQRAAATWTFNGSGNFAGNTWTGTGGNTSTPFSEVSDGSLVPITTGQPALVAASNKNQTWAWEPN